MFIEDNMFPMLEYLENEKPTICKKYKAVYGGGTLEYKDLKDPFTVFELYRSLVSYPPFNTKDMVKEMMEENQRL